MPATALTSRPFEGVLTPPTIRRPIHPIEPRIRTLLVGGPEGAFVLGHDHDPASGTVRKNLAKFFKGGRQVVGEWHWPYKKQPPRAIPLGCELVIVLVDMLSHGLSEHAETRAAERGIPFVRTSRKLAETIPPMKVAGFTYHPHATLPPIEKKERIPMASNSVPSVSRSSAAPTPPRGLPPVPAAIAPAAPSAAHSAIGFTTAERQAIGAAKEDIARRVLCEHPTFDNVTVNTRVAEAIAIRFPRTKGTPYGLEAGAGRLAGARGQLGILVTVEGVATNGGGRKTRPRYRIDASLYEPACKELGIQPNYVGAERVVDMSKIPGKAAARLTLRAVGGDRPPQDTRVVRRAQATPPPPRIQPSVTVAPAPVVQAAPAPVAPTPATVSPRTQQDAVRAAVQLLCEEVKRLGYASGTVTVEVASAAYKVAGRRQVITYIDEELTG